MLRNVHPMVRTPLLLGIDGGGTACRARLVDLEDRVRGEGTAGPANIRFGINESFAAVLRATDEALAQAGLSLGDADIIACLALAGATEPTYLAAARAYVLPFRRAVITTDAHAACVGAHGGKDGGIIIVGTGSVGWGVVRGREHRVGGWGFPVSDEGSGAWLGCEVARRVLWAHDGRCAWTGLLKRVFERFDGDPHAIVRWMGAARPRDFAALAPLVVEYSRRDDAMALELMGLAAGHIDIIAERLGVLGVTQLALAGGIAPNMEPWLSLATQGRLVRPQGDALSGALQMARHEAEAMALEPPPVMNRG
jgi:glucosamine kinase